MRSSVIVKYSQTFVWNSTANTDNRHTAPGLVAITIHPQPATSASRPIWARCPSMMWSCLRAHVLFTWSPESGTMFDKLINKAAACLRGRRTHSTQGAGDLAAFCVTISAGNIYEVTTGWPVILLSKKDTSLGLFPYFLMLLSFFGPKLVLNILLLLPKCEIWSFFTILGPKNSIFQTKNTKKVKYCLLKFCWEEFVKNQCQMMPATL